MVISVGTEEANEVMSLSSPVVLDHQFSVEGAFGAGGTPSAREARLRRYQLIRLAG